MGRQPCCDKIGLKKGPWTSEEDKKLINFILTNGQCCWRALPKRAGLLRCGKSCRLRWTNYLRPDLKRGLLSEHEEKLVIQLHSQLGNRWSKIASHLPGRTDNEIKNLWNTHIKKKLKKMGIDHLTHKQLPPSSNQSPKKPHQEEMQNENQDPESIETTDHSTTTNTDDDDDQLQENIDQYTHDNGFCTDEVPLIEPHEIIDLPSSSSSSSSFSTTSSVSNSISSSDININILGDLDTDMGFWNNYDEDFSNWDMSIDDFDMWNLDDGIIQSPQFDLTHYSIRSVLDEECRNYIYSHDYD